MSKDVKNDNKKKDGKGFENLVRGTGINLIPKKTEEEVVIETRKTSINLNSAFILMFLVIFSILVVGFNVVSKIQLNGAKAELNTLEKNLSGRSDLLNSNDEIVRRVKLYEDIKEATYSTEQIIEYWNEVSKGLAVIESIKLAQGLNFIVTGESDSLSSASKLWYLLATDDRVLVVNLKNIAKDGGKARFTYEGQLDFLKFAQEK